MKEVAANSYRSEGEKDNISGLISCAPRQVQRIVSDHKSGTCLIGNKDPQVVKCNDIDHRCGERQK